MPKKAKAGKTQMPHDYEQRHYDLEEWHRQFNARRGIIARLLPRYPKSMCILEIDRGGGASNALFSGLLKFENASICAGVPFPFGISVFEIARKENGGFL